MSCYFHLLNVLVLYTFLAIFVYNGPSKIRKSRNISFLSKCHIPFDMNCDGLHKMVYNSVAYKKINFYQQKCYSEKKNLKSET